MRSARTTFLSPRITRLQPQPQSLSWAQPRAGLWGGRAYDILGKCPFSPQGSFMKESRLLAMLKPTRSRTEGHPPRAQRQAPPPQMHSSVARTRFKISKETGDL